MNADKWNNIEQLIARLRSLLWSQRGVNASGGVLRVFSLGAGLWLALVIIAALAILPVWLKAPLVLFSVGLVLFFLWRWALAPLAAGEIQTIAKTLENRFSELKGRLTASVQFQQNPASIPTGSSPELIDLTAKQTLLEAEKLNLSQALSSRRVREALVPTLVATLATIALFALAPERVTYALEVYGQPLIEVAPPLGYQLTSSPAASQAVRFRDLELNGHLSGADFPDQAKIHYRFSGGSWQSQSVDLQETPRQKISSGDSLKFSVRLREIKRSLEFYVSAGRLQAQSTSIEVVDLPRVTGVKVSVIPPKYTGLKPEIIEGAGSFSAVVGSKARIEARSNVPLRSAIALFNTDDLDSEDSQDVRQLTPAGKAFDLNLTVLENSSFHFELRDSLNEENPNPIEYYITALEDRSPTVTVIRPGHDVDLDESLYLPLKVSISDDFGFSSLALKYTVISRNRESDETVMILHFSDNIKTDGEIEFDWDVEKIKMSPGDNLAYYFEVLDNDEIAGPKAGRSRVYHARLPAIDELIAEMEQETEERIESTEEALKRERELLKKLQEAQEKLAEQPDEKPLDWKQNKALEELLEKRQEMSAELERLAEEMRSSLEKNQNSSLMNQELAEKLKRIQELYQEVATEEMKEAQRRLQEALDNMDKEEIQQALEEFEMSEEELLSRLERTLDLLERLKIEQKINAMTEAAKELLDRQTKNNELTEEAKEEDLPQLAEEEDDIQKSLENLKEQAEELKEMLKEAELDDVEEAQEFAEAVQKSDADQDMGEMSRSLRKSKKSESSESGESAEKKLKDMLDSMREQQQAMKGMEADKMNAALRAAIEDATYLSREQEGLHDQTSALGRRSTALRDLTDEQVALEEAVAGFGTRLIKLSSSNPFLSSELRSLVGDALHSIDKSRTKLEETHGPSAADNQRDAMAKLNDVALLLLESMDKQSQCNKGGSCDKAGQKMEALGERQSKLNKETKKGMGEPKPLPGPGGERLKALAGEQEAIRKSLTELNKELGSRDEILGDLEAIAKEMEKVAEELASGEAGEQTAERQLQIYSRMLQSIKAINRRDYTPERQARAGQDFFRSSPPGLNNSDDQRPFEDRLREFLKDGYPPEYERQIRNYFKALNNRRNSDR